MNKVIAVPVMEENQVEKVRDVWDMCDEWRLPNGDLHREDGPALEWNDGTKVWFQNNVMHRNDGPAYEGCDGALQWFVHGTEVTAAEFRDWRAQFLEEQKQRWEDRQREILENAADATILQKALRITAPLRLQLRPKFA